MCSHLRLLLPTFALCGFLAGSAAAEPAKREYRSIPLRNLLLAPEGLKPVGTPPPGPEASASLRRDALRWNLDNLGKDGWEVVATSPHGFLFRRRGGGTSWTYKVLPVPASPLNAGSKDDTLLRRDLDVRAADAWEPCGSTDDGQTLIYKFMKVGEARPGGG